MELAATGFGIVNFIANVGSLVLPVVFGWFIDVSGAYVAPFYFMGIMSLVGILVTFVLRTMPAHSTAAQVGR
jgi:hypothetical protein